MSGAKDYMTHSNEVNIKTHSLGKLFCFLYWLEANYHPVLRNGCVRKDTFSEVHLKV